MRTRLVALALGLVFLTGCGGVADPVTPALEAESAQRQAEMLQRGVAGTHMDSIARAASAYASVNGSTTGFAAAIQAEQPQVMSQLAALTDTSVTVQYAPTKCVTQLIPVGTPTDVPCP